MPAFETHGLEFPQNLFKGGSHIGIPVPAASHQICEWSGGVLWDFWSDVLLKHHSCHLDGVDVCEIRNGGYSFQNFELLAGSLKIQNICKDKDLC